jgi:S1-C subfamily serine protease
VSAPVKLRMDSLSAPFAVKHLPSAGLLLHKFRALQPCCAVPKREQFVRVLGFPNQGSFASTFGRVLLSDANDRVLIETYCDHGFSGGPVVDSEGKVVGCQSWTCPSSSYRPVSRAHALWPALETMSKNLGWSFACTTSDAHEERRHLQRHPRTQSL